LPKTEVEQKESSRWLQRKYFANFACCAGLIDGIFILIQKITAE
jgi:hypothetical protein